MLRKWFLSRLFSEIICSSNYSVPEIVERYVEWVSEVKYMILSRWSEGESKNEVFAVKCAKRGNDVYRFRVYRRFKGICSMADDLAFFSPKDRGRKLKKKNWKLRRKKSEDLESLSHTVRTGR